METTKRSSELRKLIDEADQAYDSGGEDSRRELLTDDEYDALKRELAEIDPTDERLTRVGPPVVETEETQTAEHQIPMGSLNNAMNRDQLAGWYDGLRAKHDPFITVVSAKLDGGSVGLTYVEGELTEAITRGNGYVGEVITDNVRTMSGVSQTMMSTDGTPFTGFVRGEVILPKATFDKIRREKDANPRNLGNGIMRRKDGHQCHLLQFRAFRIYDSQGNIPDPTMFLMFTRLRNMGFMTPYIAVHGSNNGATWAHTNRISILKQWVEEEGSTHTAAMTEDEVRDRLSLEIDGLVISTNDTNLLGSMGVHNQRPRGEIALKFPPRAEVTTLNSVEWELGRTHKLTPVAHLEPVEIGGVTVQKATLCNPDEIKRLGIKLGDRVVVTRQGDVIPKVTKVAETSDESKVIEIPTTCPHTGAKIIRKKIGQKGELSADIYADVQEGDEGGLTLGVRVKRLEHWTKTVDIKGFGPKTLEALAEEYPDRGPSVIYEWAEGEHDLEGVSPKVCVKLRKAVAAKKQLTIPQILGGLGIEKLGVRRIEAIITQLPDVFDNLNNWLNDSLEKHAEALSLPNVYEKITAGLQANKKELQLLGQNGVRVKKFEVKEAPAEGAYVFCLTGTFSEPKKNYHDAIAAAGHTFETSFKSNVTHVVAADPGSGSSKLKQATSKGIPIVDPDGLTELLKDVPG